MSATRNSCSARARGRNPTRFALYARGPSGRRCRSATSTCCCGCWPGDIVTAELASLLVYGQLRTAQRRLARLVELGLLRGFWAASASRPRGRHAYELTRAARRDIELLSWPEGPPDRGPEQPASAPVHQLATLDLLAAFLRHGDPLLGEGLVAWVPERACGRLFGGFLRPDALAVRPRPGPRDPRCSSSATSGPSAARCWPRRSAATGRCSPGSPRRAGRRVRRRVGATRADDPRSRGSPTGPERGDGTGLPHRPRRAGPASAPRRRLVGWPGDPIGAGPRVDVGGRAVADPDVGLPR